MLDKEVHFFIFLLRLIMSNFKDTEQIISGGGKKNLDGVKSNK